jgi:hypothetical protein
MTTKINVSDYGVDVSDFAPTNAIKPYLQWFNPQSENYGFALDPKFVEVIGFKPDENWNLEDVELQDEDKGSFTGQMWFSRTPRMILLNGYQDALISNDNKIKSNPLLMQRKKTKEQKKGSVVFYDKEVFDKDKYEMFSILLVLLVDKENNLLSDTPLIFKTNGQAKSLFKNSYKEFIDDSLKQFEVLTKVTLPKQTPTCKFLSRFIFTSKLDKGTVTGKAGLSSKGTIVKSYETLTSDNFTNLVLPKDHPTLIHALSLLPDLKAYSYPSVDTNTGEINLTAQELKDLTELPDF